VTARKKCTGGFPWCADEMEWTADGGIYHTSGDVEVMDGVTVASATVVRPGHPAELPTLTLDADVELDTRGVLALIRGLMDRIDVTFDPSWDARSCAVA
jgi:hypothetical protein